MGPIAVISRNPPEQREQQAIISPSLNKNMMCSWLYKITAELYQTQGDRGLVSVLQPSFPSHQCYHIERKYICKIKKVVYL